MVLAHALGLLLDAQHLRLGQLVRNRHEKLTEEEGGGGRGGGSTVRYMQGGAR